MPITTRLTRTRRPATLRSSIDIWLDVPRDVPHPADLPPNAQPRVSFPSLNSTPRSSPSPNRTGHKTHTPSPDVKTPTAFTAPREDHGLVWQVPDDRIKAPAKRRQAAKEDVRRRQKAAVAGVLLCFVACCILLYVTRATPDLKNLGETKLEAVKQKSNGVVPKVLKRKAPSFRDSLSSTARYLTSPTHGGFAHQTMSAYHLTYLATILRRTPILPPFTFSKSEAFPVSAVFDMDRFKHAVGATPIDWKDIQPPEEKREQLGCWTAVLDDEDLEDRSLRMNEFGIEPSFYPVTVGAPQGTEWGEMNDLQIAYTFLSGLDANPSAQAVLIDQSLHASAVTTLSASPHRDPEQHVFCVDHSLFHTSSSATTAHLDQYEHTAFRAHGAALRFVPELEALGGDLAAFLLGHRGAYVAVHLSSLVPLHPFVAAVDRIRGAAGSAASSHLSRKNRDREVRHSVRALAVLVTTPVVDIGFRAEIVDLGWTLLDPTDGEIKERTLGWPMEIVEQAVTSRAAGFVGTKDNPESTLSALRVRTWRGGPVEIV